MMNLNYKYTNEELDLLKRTFAENEELFKLLRKIFLPTFSSSSSDVGGMRDDIHTSPDLDIKNYPTLEQAMIGIQAHSKSLKHVESILWQIKQLAGLKNETVEELKKRLEKDSSK